VDLASIVVTIRPGVTDWLTAVGTVAVAAAAVIIALWSDQRLRKERARERDQEQHSEAHSIQVIFADRESTPAEQVPG
jgi:hypothetical protein